MRQNLATAVAKTKIYGTIRDVKVGRDCTVAAVRRRFAGRQTRVFAAVGRSNRVSCGVEFFGPGLVGANGRKIFDFLGAGALCGESYPSNRFITSGAFCPPKPKLVETAMFAFFSRAVLGM